MASGVSEGVLFGIGCPLLDISAQVDEDFLHKHGLEADGVKLVEEEEKYQPLYQDMIRNPDVDYTPGGACLNTFRTVQWILDEPKRTRFFGCIGNDLNANRLNTMISKAGVHTVLHVDESHPTGTCACIITGNNRSLVANRAAAEHFKKDYLLQPDIWQLVKKAQYYYTSGYHLSISPDAVLAIAEHACETNKVFATNLAGTVICEKFKQPQMQVMPNVDYLFGNKQEFASFAEEQNFGTGNLEEVAKQAAALPKNNTRRQRVVVIHQGAGDTIVAQGGRVTKYPVTPVEEENIVDTNGAGDAFVGGFLAQLIQGKDITECIRCANFSANYIIKRSGITFDNKANYQ